MSSFLRRYVYGVLGIALGFFIPVQTYALEVSPAIVDLSFSPEQGPVTQTFTLSVPEDDQKTYTALLQRVVFAPDGTIQDFFAIDAALGASVTTLNGDHSEDQSFSVLFTHPELVAPDDVFGLVITEDAVRDRQISPGFIALIFPEHLLGDTPGTFRIDALTAALEHHELRVFAQFTNTSSVLVKPVSLILIQDMFGRELFRGVFAPHEGRLPVGTTRVVQDIFSHIDFGVWHVGGKVSLTLMSIGGEGGEVQQASVVVRTFPGKGFIGISLSIGVLLLIVVCAFLIKRRGILQR